MKHPSPLPASRATRKALLYSASLAAMLCMATLTSHRALAACTGPGDITVNAETCTSISIGSTAGSTPPNLLITETGTVDPFSAGTVVASISGSGGAVGNITIQGKVLNGQTGSKRPNALTFGSTTTSLGQITLERTAELTSAATYAFEFLNVPKIAGFDIDGTINIQNSAWRIGSLNATDHAAVEVAGSIINRADVALASGGKRYFEFYNATVGGDVVNKGDLTGSLSETIQLFGMKVNGDVLNEGSIGSAGDPLNAANTAILVTREDAESKIGKSIINKGDIWAKIAALDVRDTDITRSIANSGTINVEQSGILLSGTGSVTSVSNTNLITSTTTHPTNTYYGVSITGTWEITDGISNTTGAEISVKNALSHGIRIEGAEVGGEILNAGTIKAGIYGLSLTNVSTGAGALTAALKNNGTITTSSTAATPLLLTAGIFATGSTLGAVSNEGANGKIEKATTGISLSGTAVTGAVSNDAIIDANQTGISISATSDVSSVKNMANGKITVTAANADGISIANSNVGTEVSNAGNITAIRYGINLDTITGAAAVSNSKLITSTGAPLTAGIYAKDSTLASLSNSGAAASITNVVDALKAKDTTITGGVGNSGTLTATNTGILVSGGAVGGESLNSGTITAVLHGISFDGVSSTGALTTALKNTGAITSSGTLTAGISATNSKFTSISNEGANGKIENSLTGIFLSGSTVSGAVSNDATILTTTSGINIVAGSDVGSVQNKANGKITVTAANADGISIANSNVGTEVSNAGDITAIRYGITLDTVTGAAAVSNSKLITATGAPLLAGIYAKAATVASISNGAGGTITNATDGISLAGGAVSGAVSNGGSITATQHGIGLTGADAASAGSLTNSGTISANTAGLLANEKWTINGDVANLSGGSLLGLGDGISLTGTKVTGAISNAGTIDVGGTGIKLDSLAGPIAALSYGGGIKAGLDGVHIKDTSVKGGITNVAGTEITAGRHGISLTGTGTAASFVNYGTITADIAAMNAEAGWTITGDVANYSSNSLLGKGDGIRLAGTTVEGDLDNTGRIEVGGNGVSLTGTTLKGRISNTGTVTAGGTGFALADAGAISAFDNFGTITGGTTGISATGSTRIGTLTNAQGVGNAAGGLAYSGTLPTNYHIVIDGSSYGQLFVAPENHSGVMTFAISPLSNGVAPRTYSTVLTGVDTANLTNPGGVVYTFDVGNLYLRQQAGSETIWDLVMEYFYTYPDIPETLETADDTRKATDTVFAERRAVLSAAMQYDCDRFDVRGFCVELAGRVTDDEGEVTGAAVVNAAVRLAEDFRLGAFLDQQLTGTDATVDHATARLRQSYDMPLLGAYLGYKQNEDGTGLQARIAAGYQSGRLEIRRGGTDVSEEGEDETDLTAWYGFGTLGYGFGLGDGLLLTPYAGLQYTDVTRDGYGEEATAETLNPLSYDGYHERAFTLQAGVEFSGLFSEETGFEAALGLEYDIAVSADDFSGTSPIPGLETFSLDHENGDEGNLRPAGMLSLFHDVTPNRRVSATVFAGQDGFSEGFQGTALLAFRASF